MTDPNPEKVLVVLDQDDVDHCIHALEEMEAVADADVGGTIEKLMALDRAGKGDYRVK